MRTYIVSYKPRLFVSLPHNKPYAELPRPSIAIDQMCKNVMLSIPDCCHLIMNCLILFKNQILVYVILLLIWSSALSIFFTFSHLYINNYVGSDIECADCLAFCIFPRLRWYYEPFYSMLAFYVSQVITLILAISNMCICKCINSYIPCLFHSTNSPKLCICALPVPTALHADTTMIENRWSLFLSYNINIFLVLILYSLG